MYLSVQWCVPVRVVKYSGVCRVETDSGESYLGQIIGVYNEDKFMWNPTPYRYRLATSLQCCQTLGI